MCSLCLYIVASDRPQGILQVVETSARIEETPHSGGRENNIPHRQRRPHDLGRIHQSERRDEHVTRDNGSDRRPFLVIQTVEKHNTPKCVQQNETIGEKRRGDNEMLIVATQPDSTRTRDLSQDVNHRKKTAHDTKSET